MEGWVKNKERKTMKDLEAVPIYLEQLYASDSGELVVQTHTLTRVRFCPFLRDSAIFSLALQKMSFRFVTLQQPFLKLTFTEPAQNKHLVWSEVTLSPLILTG